jgi:hypothetical protein
MKCRALKKEESRERDRNCSEGRMINRTIQTSLKSNRMTSLPTKAAFATIVSGKQIHSAGAIGATNYTTSSRASRPGAAKVCLEHFPLASRFPYLMWNQRAALYWRKEWTMMTLSTTRKPITSFEAMPRRKKVDLELRMFVLNIPLLHPDPPIRCGIRGRHCMGGRSGQ